MKIELHNICKAYGDKTVLDRFSLKLDESEHIAVMGMSGCGKTTLLNIIAGLATPDSGEISGLDGKKIAFVFQEDRLAENFTVYRNIKLTAGKGVTKQAIIDSLEKTGLDKSWLNAKVSTLSGGMKRRVSIIRAVLSDCDIVLADEPTKGLDDENRRIVIDYVLESTAGKTLIWVTHDPDEASVVSKRIITL